jgi:hypothetical protein
MATLLFGELRAASPLTAPKYPPKKNPLRSIPLPPRRLTLPSMNQRAAIDLNSIIERQLAILMGIVAGLFAMAGLPERGATMPRFLRNQVTRLLRPAESVARRLIFAAARGVKHTLPPPRPKRPTLEAHHAQLRGFGLAVVVRPEDIARINAANARKTAQAAARLANPPRYLLPLIEPLPYASRPNAGPPLRKYSRQRSVPRIRSLDDDAPRPAPIPPPPKPSDAVSAVRLCQRLAALANLRSDMARHVRRLARWNARRAAGLIRRSSPLKPGRPPGSPPFHMPQSRWHEVHELLREAQWLRSEAEIAIDTS